MNNLDDVISEANCDNLHCIIDNGTSKYLCFTRLDGNTSNFIICVSDSLDLWKLEVNLDELDVLRDLSNMNMEAFLSKFRSGFQSCDIQLSQMGVKMNLTIGTGSKSLIFDLYEAKAMDKKMEVQNVLFRLAEKSTELETKLEKTKVDLDTLRKQKINDGGGAAGLGLDVEGAKNKNIPKAPTKQVGMSVVNPASKKRKVARGVNYD